MTSLPIPSLFTPVRLGRHTLRNRMVMAPMTRSRADDNTGIPSGLAIDYYRQRAGAGLVITEGTSPSAMGKGYVRAPGIYSAAQVAAWRQITGAVHARGGLIFLQLMHCGRISHPSMLPGGAQPVAPSAIQPPGQTYTATGPTDFTLPRALRTDEIAGIVDDYAQATAHALEAGFDGVELHAASGYLPEQFLASNTNQRTDGYGGNLAGRARFILEVLDAMVRVAGSDRVGIKLSPEMNFNGIQDAEPVHTYTYLVEQLAPLQLAYLHVASASSAVDYHGVLRPLFKGTYLLGGGLSEARATQLVAQSQADAVVFGSAFLANPDLPQRVAAHAALNTADRATFFSAGPAGYTDYPALADSAPRAVRIHHYGGADAVQVDTVAVPTPGPGQVLVRVHSAGMNALDWKVREGYVQQVYPLQLPGTLGSELAGVVQQLGAGVDALQPGQRVMAALQNLGAYADLVLLDASTLVPIPDALDDDTAAALPVVALTAWQSLMEAGQLRAGERVLVQGAAGGVGSVAVQLARQAGAYVVATAQGRHTERLKALGAHEVIDYRHSNFWQATQNIDLVLDLVGGDPLNHAWDVLSPAGRVVTTVAPDIAARTPQGQRGSFFGMRADTAQLADLAAQAASGRLVVEVAATLPLADAPAAIERLKTGHSTGKTVLRF